VEGASGKTAIPFLPLPRETGEAAVRDGGGPIRALWAAAAAGIEGERERELRGIDPPASPRAEVACGGLATVASGGGEGGSGGGARGAEEGLRRQGWLVVAKSVAEAPFIGEMRRWGWGEPVAAGRCVRRAVRGGVMALRPLAGIGMRRRGR